MYGSPVSKDLNLPVQPPMTSSGLLRYRSAPSTVLGDLCEDLLPPAPGAGPPRDAAGADNVFSRFLADHHHQHHIRDDKPSPQPPPAHFPSAADMASQQHQHQQMMFHSQSQSQTQQQQQMVDANKSGGLYHTVSSGMEAAAGTGIGAASNLIRQSSSPAGFVDHFSMDNGWRVRGDAEGEHGHGFPRRRRRRWRFRWHHGGLPRGRWRQAQGAAELLVAAGVADVPDLGDGQRGGRREQPRGRCWRWRQGRLHPGVPDELRRVGRLVVGAHVGQPVRDETPAGLVGARRPAAAERRAGAPFQPAQDVVGDGGHREVPPVPGRRALQDPRQARVRHAPAQHRRAGEEDKDQRANQEAAGARAQHGQANQHL